MYGCAVNPFDGLSGMYLVEIAVSEGEEWLQLTVREHYKAEPVRVWIRVDGDCCSQSWWADILGAVSAYGKEISGSRALALPEECADQTRTRQEYDRQYGFELYAGTTTVTFVFRNSSNGYYGGGACRAHPEPETRWRPITTDDWSA